MLHNVSMGGGTKTQYIISFSQQNNQQEQAM